MKKMCLIFSALLALSLIIVPAIALEEETIMAEEAEITIGGIDICIIP